MKHVNLTFSIPENLKTTLQAHVGNRKMSQFISNAIFTALREEQSKREQELEAAYEAANQDSNRAEILQDWNAFDNISDLIQENENWDWLKKSKDERKKSKHG